MNKIGFIGVGNMGSAIMKGVVKTVDKSCVYIADNNDSFVQKYADELGVIASDNQEIAKECNYIFLGVKPQVICGVLEDIAKSFKNRKDVVLISMAAGVRIEKLSKITDLPIIRIMPNLPVSIGEGMTLFATSNVSESNKNYFCEMMSKTGRLVEMNENLIDAGCAISGCGPAFVCMFIEALADAGVRCGLPRATALELAEQTLIGTSKLLNVTDTHPSVLKDAVCSPAGSTIVGVEALEQNGLRGAVIDAVVSAYERNIELGK